MTATTRRWATTRPALLLLGLTLAAADAARADEPTYLYTLTEDFVYTEGCFTVPDGLPQCLCPIAWAQEFGGTFGLTVLPSGDPLFDMYGISDIDWVVSLGQDIAITGSGLYEIGVDPAGDPVQRMTLDLFFDGSGPVAFDSGLVPGGDDAVPPAIGVPVSDGLYCPGRRITVVASPGAASPADVAPPGGDGVVDVNDFLAVLADWGLPGPRPTDIDGSGEVGIGDVLILLSEWTA